MNELRGEFLFEIAGKKHKAVISLNALRLMCQAQGIKLQELEKFMKEDELTAVCAMTYWGIKNALLLKGKDSSKFMGFEQFCAIVMDDMETFTKLGEAIGKVLGGEESDNDDSGNE